MQHLTQHSYFNPTISHKVRNLFYHKMNIQKQILNFKIEIHIALTVID